MAYLIDTSVLVRLGNSLDPQQALALRAISKLGVQGETLYITAQSLIEFRSVATRPAQNNGLGFTPSAAAREAANFEAVFPLLPDTPAIYPAWKSLADTVGASGKQVHDTRLAAVCHVYHVTHILTFNVRDFLRFQGVGPGLIVVDPNTV